MMFLKLTKPGNERVRYNLITTSRLTKCFVFITRCNSVQQKKSSYSKKELQEISFFKYKILK